MKIYIYIYYLIHYKYFCNLNGDKVDSEDEYQGGYEDGNETRYVHTHPHPHTQLKKLGITHTQSMHGFLVKMETNLDNIHRNMFIYHSYICSNFMQRPSTQIDSTFSIRLIGSTSSLCRLAQPSTQPDSTGPLTHT